MRARRVVLSVGVALACTSRAAADPAPTNLHMRTPAQCTTDGGSQLRLPAGYFTDEATHDKLDTEVKRLQTAETRLTAENASFRKSAGTWEPPWWLLAGTFASGIILGVYIESKL